MPRPRDSQRRDADQLYEHLLQVMTVWTQPHPWKAIADRAEVTIDAPEYYVIHILAREGAMRPGDLAARIMMRRSNVSKILAKTDARRWTQRDGARDDRRSVFASVTDDGRAIVSQIDHAGTQVLADLTQGWSTADTRTLTALLGRFAESSRAARFEEHGTF